MPHSTPSSEVHGDQCVTLRSSHIAPTAQMVIATAISMPTEAASV
jgi:hypothetical protein